MREPPSHSAPAGPGRSPMRDGLSISIKLPLLIGLLLVVVTGIYSWAAYHELKRSTMTAGAGRLQAVTDQLAQLLEVSGEQFRGIVRGLARSPAVREYLADPSESRKAAVLAALEPVGRDTEEVMAVELRGIDGHMILSAGDTGRWVEPSEDRVLVSTLGHGDSATVGHFFAVGDTITYAAAALVQGTAGARGYLIQWRRINSSSGQKGQIAQLIGSHANLLIGNPATGVWTDLAYRTDPPPVPVTAAADKLSYDRPGTGPVLAAARPVRGTPWFVVVEFPRASVLAPARQFVGQLALIGSVILVLALIVTWVLSRRLTGPLVRLTDAAETIAAGGWGKPIGISRTDEVGRLSASFDAMATHIRSAQEDLTERVQARTAELQERNEELEAFAYSLAHDLHAPLRALDGLSRILLEDHGKSLDGDGRRCAEMISEAARTMGQMIRDLLAYSRLARSDLQLEPLQLPAIVERATAQVAGAVAERHAKIVVEEPLPAAVGHDATLVQVLANLLGNGIKFVPAERTPEVRVRAETADRVVRLWVEDNGIGIASEHQDRIFRVFERLHPVDDYSGTGIGLAIVKKGVERMGGRVGVESLPGHGSRFWVDLPQGGAA
jgi:signal transduction histidine kinase